MRREETVSYYRSSYNDNSVLAGFGVFIVFFVIYWIGFYFFHKAGIARPYPSQYDNFVWGLLQGIYVVPSFILSLFNPEHYAIYQTPNIGGWYNFGFLLGAGAFAKGSTSH